MSMIGNYRRIPAAALDALLAAPGTLASVLYPRGRQGADRHLDLDKTWHLIHFLLNGDAWQGAWPLFGAVLGGTEVSDEDVGYGPARYLRPAEVAEVAAALDPITPEVLWSRFDAAAAESAEIYPVPWAGGADDQEYVTAYYAHLRAFFATAARAGDAVLVYIN
jgi:hypothetical protein